MKGVKLWNFCAKFAVLLMSLFVIFVINTKNTSATCTSGATSPSVGVSINKPGDINEDLVNGWWSVYESAVSSFEASRIIFKMSTTQTGYYTATWSEIYKDPQNNEVITSIAGGPGITVLDVDVASVETDGNLYYSYYVKFYKNVENNEFSFSHPIKFRSPTHWVVTAPLVTNYICTEEDTNLIISDIDSKLDGIDFLTTQLKNVLIYVSDVQLEDIKDILEDIEVNSGSSAVVDKLDEMDSKDDEDRENIEQQSSDAQSGADDSQSDAESTGTTLLAAFTAFVNALTNANPSNCNIDMDMGNLDLGVVNFCQLQPPPGFSTLSSIFMILFCVPLSIATGRKVISLFRSFQT